MSSTEPPYISMLEQAGQSKKETRAKEPMTDTKASDVNVANLFEKNEASDTDQTAS